MILHNYLETSEMWTLPRYLYYGYVKRLVHFCITLQLPLVMFFLTDTVYISIYIVYRAFFVCCRSAKYWRHFIVYWWNQEDITAAAAAVSRAMIRAATGPLRCFAHTVYIPGKF